MLPVNDLFNLVISLLIPVLIGAAVYLRINPSGNLGVPFLLAVSYGLGLGLISIWMLALSLLKIPLIREAIVFPAVAAGLILILQLKNRNLFSAAMKGICPKKGGCSERLLKNRILENVLLFAAAGYIVFQVIFVFWHSWNIPVYAPDAIWCIALKAKVFFFDEGVQKLRYFPNNTYPLHVPFTMTWTALNIDRWDEQLVKLHFPLIFLSYLMIQYVFLKVYTSTRWALLGVGLLVSSNFFVYQSTIEYREIFLVYYTMSALMFLLLGYELKNTQFWVISGLMLGIASFTKLESLIYFPIYVLACLSLARKMPAMSTRRKILLLVKWLLPGLIVVLLFNLLKTQYGVGTIPPQLRIEFSADIIFRIKETAAAFFNNFFLTANWNILWLLLVISLAGNYQKVLYIEEVRILSMVLGLYLLFYFFGSILTTNFAYLGGSHHRETLSRVILHFYPLVPLLLVLLNARKRIS